MNIRDAILKAADHIEANPKLFHFMHVGKPSMDCGTPGCALGWIGHFLNVEWHAFYPGTVAIACGIKPGDGKFPSLSAEGDFYARMDAFGIDDWKDSAAICAARLRAYADKYHPAAKPHGIPASVRAIFEARELIAEFREVSDQK